MMISDYYKYLFRPSLKMTESAGVNVKDWLLNKCKDATLLLQAEHNNKQVISCRRYGSVVLTPSNIPQFQIPRNLDVKTRDDSDTHSQSSDSSLPCSGHTSPRLSPASREPTPNLLSKPTSPHSSRSAPVSPVRSNTNARLERFNTLAGEKVDMATNADPYSLAAMSLPHLKTFTNFGFETLRESPNTRRKESLFHNVYAENAHRVTPNRKSRSCDGSPIPFNPDDATTERRPSYKRRNVPSVVAPLGVLLPLSSNESNQTISPFSRSPSPRESTSPRSAEKVRFRFSPKKEKSCRSVSPTTIRERIMMSGARRQSCGPRLLVEDVDEPRKCLNNNNKHMALCKSLSMNSDFIDDQNIEDVMQMSDGDFGIIDLVMQFNINSKMLAVTILNCRNILTKRPDLPILPFATVCLMPGKIQRQTLSLVPNANETFMFKDLSQEQLEKLKLRIRLYNKVQGLRRKDFLGEAMVYLQDYSIMEPVHINCQLQEKERNNVSTLDNKLFLQ